MKKALVIGVALVLMLGVATVADGLFGEWSTWISLGVTDIDANVTLHSFDSYLNLGYMVGGCTFEMHSIVGAEGLRYVWFDGFGSLGAFTFKTWIGFDPGGDVTWFTEPGFLAWDTAVTVSIAGVELYALMALEDMLYNSLYNWDEALGYEQGDIGYGFALGGIGQCGDARVGAEVDFNVSPQLCWYWYYGYDGGLTDWWGSYCDTHFNTARYIGPGAAIQSGCEVAFSGAQLWVEYPFTCFTLLSRVGFSCDNGFEKLCLTAYDIDLCLGWLKLWALDICFEIQTKTATYAFDVVVCEDLCFTPYFSVHMDDNVLDGIELDALTLDYDFNGVTFKWGHMFDNVWPRAAGWGSVCCDLCAAGYPAYAAGTSWYFTPKGAITRRSYCGLMIEDAEQVEYRPDEFFGIELDSDACCGGALAGGIYTFFDTDGLVNVELFDWLATYTEVTVGVGSNVEIRGSLLVSFVGVEDFGIGFGLNF